MSKASQGAKVRGADEFRVTPDDRPGWVVGTSRQLEVGEAVYCAGGEGALLSQHGKTGDGSRLLQIQLEDPKAKPFFAAASNVLVQPAA